MPILDVVDASDLQGVQQMRHEVVEGGSRRREFLVDVATLVRQRFALCRRRIGYLTERLLNLRQRRLAGKDWSTAQSCSRYTRKPESPHRWLPTPSADRRPRCRGWLNTALQPE